MIVKMCSTDSHHKAVPFSGFIRKREKLAELRRAEAEKRKAKVEAFRPVFGRYDIKRAFMFGSVLRGNSTISSDIDLYVEDVSAKDYWKLWRELEETAGRPVDLYCQLDDPVFVQKIRERGKLVYESGH